MIIKRSKYTGNYLAIEQKGNKKLIACNKSRKVAISRLSYQIYNLDMSSALKHCF